MGSFVERQQRTKTQLPTDLPNASEAEKTHESGSIYASDSGKRYRLVHAKHVAAKWVEVKPRKPKGAAGNGQAAQRPVAATARR